MPAPDAERPPDDQERRRNVVAAVALGVTAAALAVGLTVALWPPERSTDLLSELPTIPTVTPPAAELDDPLAPRSPDARPPTVTPSPSPEPTSPPASPTTPPPRRPVLVSYEAESSVNTLGGDARIHDVAEASGGHTVGVIGGNSSNILRFNRVGVPVSDTYPVTVFYISGDGDRTARVRINGQTIGTVTFPGTGNWHAVGSLTMRLPLRAGDNSIEFGNSRRMAPDVDRLTVES